MDASGDLVDLDPSYGTLALSQISSAQKSDGVSIREKNVEVRACKRSDFSIDESDDEDGVPKFY